MNLRPLLVAALLLPSAAGALADEPGRRWIIDSAASLKDATLFSEAGDVLVLRAGDAHAGPIVLRSGQSLIGEGETPAVITASEGAVVTIAGTSDGVRLENLSIRAEGEATGVLLREVTGTVTLQNVAITAAGPGLQAWKVARMDVAGTSVATTGGGPAVAIADSELEAVFTAVSARGAGLERGIVLERTTGRVTFESGTIEGAAVRAVSAISATNVTLRKMRIAGSAARNDVTAFACGGDLARGKNAGCNAAVYLQNVDGATLENVTIDGSGQAGVVAHAVNRLALSDTQVRNAGDELFEHGLVLQELGGACRIERTTVERSASRHLMLHNSRGSLTLTLSHCRFADSGKPHGQQGVLVTADGEAHIELAVRDSAFVRTFSHALDVMATGAAKISLQVTGNSFEDQAAAVNVAVTGGAVVDVVISDNPTVLRSTSAPFNLYLGTPSNGRLTGTIARNVIGTSGVAGSGTTCNGCGGIVLTAGGDGVLAAEVTGNIVQQTGGPAIFAAAGPGRADMSLTVSSNLLREPRSSSAPAIRVSSAATAADATITCADLGGTGVNANTIEGSWDATGAIQLLHRFPGARFLIAGLTGDNSELAVAAFVSRRNHGAGVRAFVRPDPKQKGFESAARCVAPAVPQ